MIVFHVTTVEGLRGIRRDKFIDPMKATSHFKRSWFVERSRISWAIGHVQLRHGVNIYGVRVIQLEVSESDVQRFSDSMKFNTAKRIPFPGGEFVTRAQAWAADEEGGEFNEFCKEVAAELY